MQKLVSIDLQADFGFFRKPDTNDFKKVASLSYNILHKPALLGILGAIVGLGGYETLGEVPEYYTQLEQVKIGVAPLNHEKGNFARTNIKYSNTIGYANKGTNYLTEESTLIKPAYRCYLLLDTAQPMEQKLCEYLQAGKAEYLPYFGKNECYAWWEPESFEVYDFEVVADLPESVRIETLFEKSDLTVKDETEAPWFDMFNMGEHQDPYMYFERLPKGFDEQLHQYELGEFSFTTFHILPTAQLPNLFYLSDQQCYVQLL